MDELKEQFGVLTVLVGLPGSGKSTWADENAGKAVIISTDQIRKELNGDAADQSNGGQVWQLAYNRARYWLHLGFNVIFDATNYGRANRRHVLHELKDHAREVYAVFFNTPKAECKRRNAARERVVPYEVIEGMADRLTVPTEEEGFDRVFII